MMYSKGQSIEVGYGDFVGDAENGGSYFLYIDVPSISEDDIVEHLKDDNVLYIQAIEDKQSVDWSKDNPISNIIK